MGASAEKAGRGLEARKAAGLPPAPARTSFILLGRPVSTAPALPRTAALPPLSPRSNPARPRPGRSWFFISRHLQVLLVAKAFFFFFFTPLFLPICQRQPHAAHKGGWRD